MLNGLSFVPVYRFFNRSTLAHFYTTSEDERAAILANMPAFSLEGAAFKVSGVPAAGLEPVHRFLNQSTGVHFYTISATEKAYLMANLPQFRYEGVAYYASQVPVGIMKPLYRFFVARTGTHFYSASESEKNQIVNTLPGYSFENAAYFVVDSSYAPIPHSGITDQQCYEAGSDIVVACSASSVVALNSQQDGHRTAVNTMSYSEVPKPGGGTYARTECIKDNGTGLVWEGKTASGLRASSNTYSNYDDPNKAQKPDGSRPTQAEVGAADNTMGYVKSVNALALCGYSDWRRPTPAELQSIVDYSFGPANLAWFPNAGLSFQNFWSSSADASNVQLASSFGFTNGGGGSQYRYVNYAVRLVRGGQ